MVLGSLLVHYYEMLFLFNLFPDFRQVFLHPFGILIGDNLQQPFQFQADILHLSGGAGIEQDFLKQVVVLAQQTFGDGHVLLKVVPGAS